MIELRWSPGGMLFQVEMDMRQGRRCFKKPDPKSTAAPALPPPVTTPEEIAPQAAAAGEAEGRRLRRKTGRRATRLTPPSIATSPANTAQAGLKTKLGATV